MIESNEVTSKPSSGSVFADLGFADAEEMRAKADLAAHIYRAIKTRGLKKTQVTKILGVRQSELVSLMNARLDEFSTDRLMHFLNDLGCDVSISVSAPHKEGRGHLVLA